MTIVVLVMMVSGGVREGGEDVKLRVKLSTKASDSTHDRVTMEKLLFSITLTQDRFCIAGRSRKLKGMICII